MPFVEGESPPGPALAASASSRWEDALRIARRGRPRAPTTPTSTAWSIATSSPRISADQATAAATVGASESRPLLLDPGDFAVVDTGDPLPDGFDAVVMREHVHHERRPRRAARRRRRPTSTCARSARTSAPPSCCCPPATGCGRWTSPRRRPPARPSSRCGAPRSWRSSDRRRDAPHRHRAGPGRDPRHQLAHARRPGARAGCEAVCLPIVPDDPDVIAERRAAAAEGDLLIVVAGSSAGRDDYTARSSGGAGTLAVHGVAVGRGTRSCSARSTHTGARRARVPGVGLADVRHLRRPAARRARGRRARERPDHGAARPQARLDVGMDDWVRVRLGPGRRRRSSPLRCRAVPACSPRWCAPTGCWSSRPGWRATTPVSRSTSSCCAARGDRGARSWRSARTTSCSTWPPPSCAPSDPQVTLASRNVGSLGGLVALRDGLCHIAGSHLLDPDTGEYTLPYVDGSSTGGTIAVVRLVHREQGLIVAPGNPLGLCGVEDLARPDLRYVNRQRGAGTRVLLDHELARRGIDAGHDQRLLARGAHASGGGRGGRRGPRRRGTGRARRGARVRARLRAGRPGALRPRAGARTARRSGRLAPLWALLETPDFRAPSRRSAATHPPRWAAGSGDPGKGAATPRPREVQPPPIAVVRMTSAASTGSRSPVSGA